MFRVLYRVGPVPFFPIALATALGIVMSVYLGKILNLELLSSGMIVVFAITALLFYLSGKDPKYGRFNRLLIVFLFFFFGLLLTVVSQSQNQTNYFFSNEKTNHAVFLKLRITEPLNRRENSWRAEAEIVSAIDSIFNVRTTKGKVLVYWSKREYPSPPKVNYGDMVLVRNKVIELPGPELPGAFDFKGAMFTREISHQIYLQPNAWRKCGNRINVIKYWAFVCSNWLENKLLELFPGRIGGTMASLLIGAKANLDKEDVDAFSKTGTIHVLAVSGMHVGLIYGTLIYLLNFGDIKKRKLIWKSLLVILIIWFYSYVTGLGASIVRASLMFTIMEVGRSFLRKKGNTFNSVFISMFIQLVYNPLVLFDIGFQLSYLAVLGILFFYEPLKKLWTPENNYVNQCWKLTVMSLAATLATLPVVLFVFKSFPVWFLPANLVIVPLSSLLIYLGIITLVFFAVPLLGKVLVWICTHLTLLLLYLAQLISELPGRITDVQLTTPGAIFLMLFIVFTGMFLWYYPVRFNWYLAILMLLITGILSVLNYSLKTAKSELIITKIDNRQLLLIKKEEELLCIYNLPPESNKTKDESSLQNYMKKNYIRSVERVLLPEGKLGWKGISVSRDNRGNWLIESSNQKWSIYRKKKAYVCTTSLRGYLAASCIVFNRSFVGFDL